MSITDEKKMTKQRTIAYIILGAIAIALLVVGTFYDLEIDDLLYKPSSLFANLLEDIGTFPVYLLIAFIGAAFFSYSMLFPKKGFNLVKIIFSAVACFVGFTLLFERFVKIWIESSLYRYLIAAPIAAVFTALTLPAVLKINPHNRKKLAIFALFTLIVVATSMIIMKGIKTAWGRPRYREMLKADDFTPFTKWYKPYGIAFNEIQQSFPSGHTASASLIMVIAALPEIFNRLKKYEWLLFGVGLLYSVAVAVSRLIAGAHFLTDVVMGAVVTISTYAIVRALFFKRWRSAIESVNI